MTNMLSMFLMTAALGQPPSWRSGLSEDDLKELGSYVKLEILGLLEVKGPIDNDPKQLTDYSREGSVFVGADFQGFQLFLGEDPKLPALAKKLSGKFVVVQGDMVVLHAPGVLLEY